MGGPDRRSAPTEPEMIKVERWPVVRWAIPFLETKETKGPKIAIFYLVFDPVRSEEFVVAILVYLPMDCASQAAYHHLEILSRRALGRCSGVNIATRPSRCSPSKHPHWAIDDCVHYFV